MEEGCVREKGGGGSYNITGLPWRQNKTNKASICPTQTARLSSLTAGRTARVRELLEERA